MLWTWSGCWSWGGKLYEKEMRDIAGGRSQGFEQHLCNKPEGNSTSVTNINRVPGLLDFLQYWWFKWAEAFKKIRMAMAVHWG